MKINLWYSKSMTQWRWTLCEEYKNGVTKKSLSEFVCKKLIKSFFYVRFFDRYYPEGLGK